MSPALSLCVLEASRFHVTGVSHTLEHNWPQTSCDVAPINVSQTLHSDIQLKQQRAQNDPTSALEHHAASSSWGGCSPTQRQASEHAHWPQCSPAERARDTIHSTEQLDGRSENLNLNIFSAPENI